MSKKSKLLEELSENLKDIDFKEIGTDILINQLRKDLKDGRNTILSVFKTNPARNLYERVGFKIYEETNNHYKMRRKI